MNIQFYSKNIELNTQIKSYVQEKIGGLEKYDSQIIDCRIDLSKNIHHKKGDVYRVEVNIKLAHNKKLIRAVVMAENLMSGIDQVKDKLQRQITKTKDKIKNR